MQKPSLQFETEEELRQFLKEAREKSEKGDEKEEWHEKEIIRQESKPRGGMNYNYHYYRMLVFLASGVILIAIGSNQWLTAAGVGLVALALILHQATMSLVIREDAK